MKAKDSTVARMVAASTTPEPIRRSDSQVRSPAGASRPARRDAQAASVTGSSLYPQKGPPFHLTVRPPVLSAKPRVHLGRTPTGRLRSYRSRTLIGLFAGADSTDGEGNFSRQPPRNRFAESRPCDKIAAHRKPWRPSRVRCEAVATNKSLQETPGDGILVRRKVR